jgi:hypothetical protein
MTGSAFCSFFVYFFQQEFVSFGIVLISIILDLDRHLSFIQCRTPYHPFATSGCTISLDMSSALQIKTSWIPFSWTQGWGVFVCP